MRWYVTHESNFVILAALLILGAGKAYACEAVTVPYEGEPAYYGVEVDPQVDAIPPEVAQPSYYEGEPTGEEIFIPREEIDPS